MRKKLCLLLLVLLGLPNYAVATPDIYSKTYYPPVELGVVYAVKRRNDNQAAQARPFI
jgi:hypothetical protein